MTTLSEVFDKVQPSIVAFASQLGVGKADQPPLFPPIIGTGFVVDPRGIVATNRHVVEAMMQLPVNPMTGSNALAAMFSPVMPDGEGFALSMQFVDIVGVQVLSHMETSGSEYYGEAVPDLAFVMLRVKDVPFLKLATDDWSVRIGMDVATAGFPLGTDPLVVHGVFGQATPLLRRGVVSSLNPFPCPQPHGFTIDVMSQGGASGSPIFRTDMAEVVGIVHAGFVGTNITLAVPSYFVSESLRLMLDVAPVDASDYPTLSHLQKNSQEQKGALGPGDWTAIVPAPEE